MGRGRFCDIQNWIGAPGTPIEGADFVPPDPSCMKQALHGLGRVITTQFDPTR